MSDFSPAQRDTDATDPRFSLANERTLLAWSRTIIGLLAGGVALQVVDLQMDDTLTFVASVTLIATGVLAAPAAILHSRSVDRAIRNGKAAPRDRSAIALTAILAIVGVVVLAAVVVFWLSH